MQFLQLFLDPFMLNTVIHNYNLRLLFVVFKKLTVSGFAFPE